MLRPDTGWLASLGCVYEWKRCRSVSSGSPPVANFVFHGKAHTRTRRESGVQSKCMRFHGYEKIASRPQKSAHEQFGKLGHPEYAQLRGMDQPVKEIAASHSFVEYHHVQKRHRCLVSDIRQMLEALFAGLRIKPRIRYALVH